jgi:hypothetical protein
MTLVVIRHTFSAIIVLAVVTAFMAGPLLAAPRGNPGKLNFEHYFDRNKPGPKLAPRQSGPKRTPGGDADLRVRSGAPPTITRTTQSALKAEQKSSAIGRYRKLLSMSVELVVMNEPDAPERSAPAPGRRPRYRRCIGVVRQFLFASGQTAVGTIRLIVG